MLEGGLFFECPRWRDGRWYVTDIYRRAVLTLREDGSDVRDVATFDTRVSGTGWLPDGSLLVVAIEDLRVLRVDPTGAVTTYADLHGLGRGMVNDMVVDRHGRAFVGLLGWEIGELGHGEPPPPGHVLRVDPGGVASVAAGGVVVPNGMVITDDGSTLIVGESLASRYTAFTIAADGSLGDARVWATLTGPRPDGGAAPDGCGLDAEGRVWFADSSSARFVLVEEGGTVVDEIACPDGLNAYACMLGGADGRQLVLCCGAGHTEEERVSGSSVLLATTVATPHAGLP